MGRAPNIAFLHAARAVFLSPHFLYRTELGGPGKDERTTLTSHERASALSYLLTNGPPDAELMAAANRNQLSTPEQVTAHSTRLLKDAETARGVFAFLFEHFGYDGVRDVTKDEKLFPGFSKGLAAELAQETATFLRQVLWADDGRLGTILSAPYSMLTPRLQGYYGMTAPKDDTQYRKIMLPEVRRGILTQGSFLARMASSTDTNPVGRGAYVRGHLLCQEPPPPPPDLMIPELSTSKTLTTRERLAAHGQPACAGCHRLMDDLGLAFENYDPSGKFRMQDAGKPIDAAGAIADFDLPENTFANAVQLAQRLSGSPRVRACFAERFFEYAHGRAVSQADACEMHALRTKFEALGGDVRALVAALAASDGFLARSTP
jgi:hypothetical protein